MYLITAIALLIFIGTCASLYKLLVQYFGEWEGNALFLASCIVTLTLSLAIALDFYPEFGLQNPLFAYTPPFLIILFLTGIPLNSLLYMIVAKKVHSANSYEQRNLTPKERRVYGLSLWILPTSITGNIVYYTLGPLG